MGIQKQLLDSLKECSSSGDIRRGKKLHAHAIATNLISDKYIANSLLSMYAKCGSLLLAQSIFDALPIPDFVSHTALILAYAENQRESTALQLFSALETHQMNSLTFLAATKACTALISKSFTSKSRLIERGGEIHRQACDSGLYSDVLANSLVAMYSKGNRLDLAREVFEKMPGFSAVSWNTILLACTENYQPDAALDLFFHRMLPSGLPPNARTFVAILGACSSAASEEEAAFLDGSMIKVAALQSLVDRGLLPLPKHGGRSESV